MSRKGVTTRRPRKKKVWIFTHLSPGREGKWHAQSQFTRLKKGNRPPIGKAKKTVRGG